jgi:aryl-alcohol dehydrogenase-like predicted oxidoreductase
MEQRPLGKTGLSVSVLGYGCGAIGGLMVKGTATEQDRAIGRAIDQGITYFDKPDGVFYPMDQIKAEEQFIKEFSLNPFLRPKSPNDLIK